MFSTLFFSFQEPATKRAKYDDSALHEAVQQVKQGLDKIKGLRDANSEQIQPSWFVDELKLIKDQVLGLLSKQ